MVLIIGYLQLEFFYLQKHFPDIRGIICCDLREVQENKTQSSKTKIDRVYVWRALLRSEWSVN